MQFQETITIYSFSYRPRLTIARVWQSHEDRIMTKWWHCRLTNEELPSHGQAVGLIPIQGLKSTCLL